MPRIESEDISSGGGSLTPGLLPLGTWNPSTNVPNLASSVGTENTFYICSADGTTNLNGINDWKTNDWAVFTLGIWKKISGGSVSIPPIPLDYKKYLLSISSYGQTNFTLPVTPDSLEKQNSILFINGIKQEWLVNYNISGNILSLILNYKLNSATDVVELYCK